MKKLLLTLVFLCPARPALALQHPALCEGAFAQLPPVIAAFERDLFTLFAADIDVKPLAGVSLLLEEPDYADLAPELRAQLLSFVMAAYLPRQHHRQDRLELAQATSRWLSLELEKIHAYTKADLERLRLAYRVALARLAPQKQKSPPVSLKTLLSKAHTRIAIDGILAIIASMAFGSPTDPVIIPACTAATGLVGSAKMYRHGRRWLERTREYRMAKADYWRLLCDDRAQVEVRFNLLLERQDLRALRNAWDSSLNLLLTDAGRSRNANALVVFTEKTSSHLLSQLNSRREKLALLTHMAASYKRVNPSEWHQILEAFSMLKTRALQLKITHREAAKLQDSVEKVVAGWHLNPAALHAAESFFQTPWNQRHSLPPP